MSYIGQNLSSTPSDFNKPTYPEMEATAATKNLQVNLGIMPDTLSVPISDLGKDDTWKYKGTSSRPSLPPIHSLRTANPETDAEPSNAWRSKYDQLVNDLPGEIKSALIANRALAREEQFTSLVALEYTLTNVAKALVVVESATNDSYTDAALMRKEINQQINKYVQNNYQNLAGNVLQAIKDKMEIVGRNDPSFDGISYYSDLAESGLSAMDVEESI